VHIVVCVKEIVDPDIPAAKFRIDEAGRSVVPPEGIPPVVNPYDAQAVELALKLKEKQGGKVTVLTVGAGEKAVKNALSMGADEGFVLSDPAFDGSDGFAVAHVLASAIRKLGAFDLVLCGRQAADWDEGLTGSLLAEELGLPLVTLAAEVEAEGEKLRVGRVTLDGRQVFSIPTPAVVTVSNEAGRPRLPSGWGIIKAARTKVPAWGAADIGADASRVGAGAARRSLSGIAPVTRERKVEIVTGKTVEEASALLADRLREKGIV